MYVKKHLHPAPPRIDDAFRTEFRIAVLHALRDAFTERQYQALILHYAYGKSQKEIALLWGISPSAVCRHMRRGRQQLIAQFASYPLRA